MTIFDNLGWKRTNYRECKRTEYKINNSILRIDSWPLIPTMVTILSQTEDELEEILKLLNMANKTTTYNIENIYEEIYGINITEIETLKF